MARQLFAADAWPPQRRACAQMFRVRSMLRVAVALSGGQELAFEVRHGFLRAVGYAESVAPGCAFRLAGFALHPVQQLG
jgi:hypothetical protein